MSIAGKYYLSIILSGFALSGCVDTGRETNTLIAASRPVSDGWQPGEMISPPEAGSVISVHASRTGVTPSGNTYRYYYDGSGSVRPLGGSILSGWSIDCQKDTMNDRRNCKIRSSDAKLVLLYDFRTSPRWVCITHHDFPGRRGQIRLDSNAPMTTDTDGCVRGSIASNLRKAKTVTVRYVEWPYDYSKDNVAEVAGVGEAMDLAKVLLDRLDTLSF